MRKLSRLSLGLALTAVLSGCGIDEGPGGIRSVRGTAQAYSGPDATVEANLGAGHTVARGTISAAGGFSLELPESVPAEQLVRLGDTLLPGLSASDPDAYVGTVNFDVADGGTTSGVLVLTSFSDWSNANDPGEKQVDYTYADRDVAITGTYSSGGNEIVFELALQSGWNLQVREVLASDAEGISLKVTHGSAAGVSWRFFE